MGRDGTAGEASTFKRARRDLQQALAGLTQRGERLAGARYVRARRGSLITAARRIRAESIDVVTLAVIAEHTAGATWAEIAEALAQDEQWVREHYEPIEAEWLRGRGVGPVLAPPPDLRLVGE